MISSSYSEKRHIKIQKNLINNYYENFSKVSIFEEMCLQQLTISNKIINQNNGK